MSNHAQISLTVAAVALSASTAALAQQPILLPGITIESATLEKAPVAKPRATRPAETDTAPAPKPQQQAQPDVPAVIAGSDTQGGDTTTGIPQAQIGSAVSVVTATDLQQQQVRTTADALRTLPGVSVAGYARPAASRRCAFAAAMAARRAY